jgi:hypothetical protein
VKTPAVYLGVIGFGLVIAMTYFAHRRAHECFEQLRPIFTVSDIEYKMLLDSWFARLGKPGGVISVIAPFALLSSMVIVTALAVPEEFLEQFGLQALRPSTFPKEWYQPEFIVPSAIIYSLYGLAVAAALGTATRMLVLNLQFLTSLHKHPILPVPTLVRARLRRVANLYIIVSGSWTVGVLLFAVLVYGDYGLVPIIFIGVLFSLGVLTLIVPQLIFRQYVYASYDRLCGLALTNTYERSGVRLEERKTGDWEALADSKTFLAGSLADLLTLTSQPKVWVYDGRDFALWVGAQVTAIVLVAVQLLSR